MPEQALDSVHVGAGFEQVGGKCVAQRMDAARLGNTGARLCSVLAGL